ncbi:ComEA family DNA-binding protein [Trinickia diaoshuihuensis]|jgi:competence protein ComEA|uniref:ComEA family DNA-binding protein n=1 Tax=Trinickia diaoshuihuensis TaxID=2292265 RepID=UPI000E21EBF8|nr:helix-hairpin-helix domain-containing protein [Trinickia diaoshuihuensis]
MFKRILSVAVALAAACSVLSAHAVEVDVNTADEAALRAIKGIGPAKARAIVDERTAGGPFKDADDLGQRVKGLGGQAVERLRAGGLTVGDAWSSVAPRLGRALG